MTTHDDTTTTTAHAWADGYGTWRAAVREDAAAGMTLAEQRDAAYTAVARELLARGASDAYVAAMPVVQVIRPGDGAPSWVEAYPGYDHATMTTDQVCHRCGMTLTYMSYRGSWVGDLGNDRCDDGPRHAPA